MIDLNFASLHSAVLQRLQDFKHCHPNGVNDWRLSQWSNALAGEVGESCNIIKKIERGDFTFTAGRSALGAELADVQSYLILLSARADIDLGLETILKFNAVSDRVGSAVRLSADPPVWKLQETVSALWSLLVKLAHDRGVIVHATCTKDIRDEVASLAQLYGLDASSLSHTKWTDGNIEATVQASDP